MSTNDRARLVDLASAAQLEAAGYTQLAAELRARHRAPRKIMEQATADMGGDPVSINQGNCDVWANRVAAELGGVSLWLDVIDADKFPVDNQPRIGHCVVALDGRYYDSEHLDGVADIGVLAGLEAGELRRFDPGADADIARRVARHRRPTVPTPADHAECARCRAPAIVGERITVCERGHVEPMAVRP